jgi:hypothetical protein
MNSPAPIRPVLRERLVAACILGLAGAGPAAACPDAEGEPCRVGGDLEVAATAEESRDGTVVWRSGRSKIDTPLPEGYAAPTPPGAIEIKSYPVVRRAVTEVQRGRNGAFWPLFNHIKDRGIAMTSPVEMDYAGLRPGEDQPIESATMAFLYRRTDQGPQGFDGRVEVADLPPVTVLAIGVRGRHGMDVVVDELDRLDAWLAEHPEWEVAGDARALHYNGPMTWPRNKWSEVQVPVRRR